MFLLHVNSNKVLVFTTVIINVCSLCFPKEGGGGENDLYMHLLPLCGLK